MIEVADATPSVGVVNDGEVVIATLPVPDMVYSPKTPALSYRTRVVVPDAIVVVPTVSEAAGPVSHDVFPEPSVFK